MKKINLPFTTKGGNKDSFKILNDVDITNKVKKDKSFYNTIKKLITFNNSNNSNNNSYNKINYIKSSETKKYYQNIKK